jgi:hypothetical protein
MRFSKRTEAEKEAKNEMKAYLVVPDERYWIFATRSIRVILMFERVFGDESTVR